MISAASATTRQGRHGLCVGWRAWSVIMGRIGAYYLLCRLDSWRLEQYVDKRVQPCHLQRYMRLVKLAYDRRSSLHALDALPPVPLLRPVAGQLRPLRLPSRPRINLLRRPPRLVAALLPRARLRETLALTAWVTGAIPAPPRRRLLVEDDHDLFIASHDLFNNLPVSLMVRWCYGSCCCPLPPAPSIDGICLLLHLMVYCSFDCWTSVTGGSTSARTSGAPPTSRSTSRTKTTTLGRSSSGRRTTTSPACSTACPSPSPTRTSPRW